jgi:Tfp pilus assembly protein PilX
MKTPKTRRASSLSGFALVITLSLMVLLTVIAVGLMTLSSISLRSSSRSDAMATARANARLALALAIGELQTFAGPDQRTTGTANLAGSAAGDELAPGAAPLNNTTVNSTHKGLTAVQPGTRYWTGVWRNSNLINPGIDIYTKTPSPTHLQWLVSGNEVGATPQFTPAASAFSVSADGSVADPESAVLMVGPGSVGDSSSAAADNYVAVPLVEIAANGPAATAAPGRYAWWIGDEGVKAKFNRTPSDSAAGQATTYPDLVAPRSGWEVVEGMEAYPTPDSGNLALLERVVTLRQGELLSPTLDPANSSLPQSIFHAATTDGFGVLADNLQGGLRIDLTTTFAKGLPSRPTSSFPNAPALNVNLVPTTIPVPNSSRLLKGPKWDRVAAFHSQAKKTAADGKLTVKAASSSAIDITIAPIIIDLRLLMGVKLVKMDDSQYQIHPCGKIAVALANPYPFPLAWTSDLELTMLDETPQTNNQSSRVAGAAGTAAYFSNKGQPAVFNNASFVIPRGELAPGEAQAFTVANQVVRPANSTAAVKVGLTPFSSSSPGNFDNCVIQEETAPNSGSKALDVRESWTTTQVTADLRLSGGKPLRRLERFELDNGFYASVRRPVSPADADRMTRPFPLHLFSFQISQPGMRYDTLLPSSDLMGTRSSTVRTFMDFNLQAVRFGKLITSYNPPPYFMESSDSLASLPFLAPGGDTGSAFTRNLAITPLSWGRDAIGGVKKTVLFSFPETFVSLAQLQHADLSADDELFTVSHQPGNAVGNSYATPFVKRKQTIQRRENYIVTGVNGGESVSSTKTPVTYYDMSYLLNAALWDTYFFSTVDGGRTLNRNITVRNASATDELADPSKASSQLLVDGAFNINSTNKNAWKALLAGNRLLRHPADGAAGDSGDALFPRSLEQPAGGLSQPTGTGDDSFSGFRRLSNDQIDAVAEEMVRQVRLRGPFVSLSHFVNRALIDLTLRRDPNTPLSASGALQSALDNAGANISPDGTKSAFTNLNIERDELVLKPGKGNAPMADLWGTQPNGSRGSTYGGQTEDRHPVWAAESKDLNAGAMASIYADRLIITERALQPQQGYRSTGLPGWITQADVLQAIGPVIAARSDTFRVRGYGEALAPDGRLVLARAWCEAVVQRMPDYVDPANLPSERAATPADATLSPANKAFGRRFNTTSFRWLSQHDI